MSIESVMPSNQLNLCHPLLHPAFNLSQHQGLFQWASFSHQVAKVLEFQLQHQSFQWTPRTDLLVQFSSVIPYNVLYHCYLALSGILFPISRWEDWGSSEAKWSSIFSRRVKLEPVQVTGKSFVYFFEMVILLCLLALPTWASFKLGSYAMLNPLLFPSMHSTPTGLQS